jgi:hypothetical protein
MTDMDDIVIRDRTVARVLALLPALVVAVCVRVLTLGSPPVAIRVLAAAAVAGCCWTAYRLLTASVTVSESGVRIRGVFYDADVTWEEVMTVERATSGPMLRLLVWGVMSPHSVALVGRSRTLRPVALLSGADDDEVDRAVGAIRVRAGAWRLPDHG